MSKLALALFLITTVGCTQAVDTDKTYSAVTCDYPPNEGCNYIIQHKLNFADCFRIITGLHDLARVKNIPKKDWEVAACIELGEIPNE